jgi:hypothetical protein
MKVVSTDLSCFHNLKIKRILLDSVDPDWIASGSGFNLFSELESGFRSIHKLFMNKH